jgi:PIN domain nuclease of toxin-antitoxin system
MTALLDTHVLLYWFEDEGRLSEEQRHVLASASAENPLFVSDITLWEVATLYNLKRITLDRPLRVWLERATAPPLVSRIGISPAVAAETARIPASFHLDPADRILVATAMILGAVLVTSDRRIREASLVPTV